MDSTLVLDWTLILTFGNLVLSSAIAILALSLLAYLLAHNLYSGVAQAFSALLACVLVVYSGDIVVARVSSQTAELLWLRFQWLGIAFVPAAYLHLSDAIFRTTRMSSNHGRTGVLAAYIAGAVLCLLALTTDLVVRDGIFNPPISRLAAGPLFWVFAAYYAFTTFYGAYNINRARRRALTLAARRRMAYLTLAFIGPAVGVFPYLATMSLSGRLVAGIVFVLSLAGNVAVSIALVVMAYTVAYYGVLTPERVVKGRLVHYLLRGPLMAAAVVAIILTIPKVEAILGLPRDTVVLFAVVLSIVILELGINAARPIIDRLIYRGDQSEIAWIQELDERLLTTSDLQQFLSNVLVVLCEVLQVPNAFIAGPAGNLPTQLEASSGSGHLPEGAPERWLREATSAENGTETLGLVPQDGYWVRALRNSKDQQVLGFLAISARAPRVNLTSQEQEIVANLIQQAELALEDRQLQQEIFASLQRIMPEIERLQQLGGAIGYTVPEWLPTSQSDIRDALNDPQFPAWVKEALAHYWGGPKLTRSPLLQLQIEREALQEDGGNPAKALRRVLDLAIERLRPEGARQMTASDWVLYNILELKFIQGKRVREVAEQLAMSESDLYRKQRVAIEEVARALATMEVMGTADTGSDVSDTGPTVE